MILSDGLPTPGQPATVHVVPVKAAEQVMAGVQGQLSALEAELDAVMRAVADAERRAEVAVGESERFLALADHLLDQAQQLRIRPGPAGSGDPARRVLHLRTAAPPPDTIG